MISTRDVIIRANLVDAKKFYNGVLDFPIVTDSERLVGFDTGSFTLYAEPGAGPGPVFDFLVDDLAQAKADLLASGCELIEENPEIPRCYMRDALGLLFNLAESERPG